MYQPQYLTEEAVRKTFEDAHSKLIRNGEMYKKGFIDQQDYDRNVYKIYYENFWEFLSEHGIYLKLKEANFLRFTEEYRLYQNGQDTDGADLDPWLYNLFDNVEASKEEKKSFFYLMDQFHLPTLYFEPEPESLLKPNLFNLHTYSNIRECCTYFNCIDDGGLLEENNPVDKTFRLVNDLGLEAVVTIKEDRRTTPYKEREQKDFDIADVVLPGFGVVLYAAEFFAEGYIEGYTAKEREFKLNDCGRPSMDPTILIRVNKNGKISYLAYNESFEDSVARTKFSLWQDYYQWCDEKYKNQLQILKSFSDSFKS